MMCGMAEAKQAGGGMGGMGGMSGVGLIIKFSTSETLRRFPPKIKTAILGRPFFSKFDREMHRKSASDKSGQHAEPHFYRRAVAAYCDESGLNKEAQSK